MKKIIGLIVGFVMLTGICFSEPMDAVHYNAYLFARGQTNWAAAEVLTSFPDVKGWMEWHQGMEYIAVWKNGKYHYLNNVKKEDLDRAAFHFEQATTFADAADKEGRSGKGKNSITNLRLMISHGTSYIKRP